MNDNVAQEIWKMKIKGIFMLLLGVFLSFLYIAFLVFLCNNFPNVFTGGRHDPASLICIIPTIGLFFYWIKFGIFVKDFENKVKKEFAPKIMKNLVQDNGDITWVSDVLHMGLGNSDNGDNPDDINYSWLSECGVADFFQVFKGFCSFKFKDLNRGNFITIDDFFCGTYKGAEFVSAEIDIESSLQKNSHRVFKGLIIEIKTNKNFSPILIKSGSQPYLKLPPEYKKIHDNNNNLSPKYHIYAEENTEIPQFPTSFYSFINGLWKMFSFGFAENRIVVIANVKKDLFKLVSLFKSLNNEGQYKQFRDEFFLMLNIIEKLSKIVNEDEYGLYNN